MDGVITITIMDGDNKTITITMDGEIIIIMDGDNQTIYGHTINKYMEITYMVKIG